MEVISDNAIGCSHCSNQYSEEVICRSQKSPRRVIVDVVIDCSESRKQ